MKTIHITTFINGTVEFKFNNNDDYNKANKVLQEVIVPRYCEPHYKCIQYNKLSAYSMIAIAHKINTEAFNEQVKLEFHYL